jgi:hypothetical protein
MFYKRNIIFFSVLMILTVSCTKTNKNSELFFEATERYDIDLTACVDETPPYACKNSITEEFCDIEIIPLENNSEALMGEIDNMQVCDNGFYIINRQEKYPLFYYKHDGSFGAKIGENGHSRAEYTTLWNFSANTAGDTVAVLDYNYVRLYDSNGTFINAYDFKDTQYWQGFLYTDKGVFLSTSNRCLNSVLAQYTHDFRTEHPIIEGQVNLIRDNPSSWQNLIRRDGQNICYYDYYTATFYIFDTNNMKKSKSFTLHSPNGLAESKIRNMDVSSQDFDHLISYVFEDNIIWGKFNYGGVGYNLKLDVKTGTCQLKRFSDLGYGFLCSHNGWYYQAFEPAQLMMLINSDKQAPWPIWTLLEEALEPYKDKINETDNYYILRMRKKNDN